MTAQLHSFSAETSSRNLRSSDEGEQGMCQLGEHEPELGEEPTAATRGAARERGGAEDETRCAGSHQVYRDGHRHRQGHVRQEKRKHASGGRPRRHTGGQHRRSGKYHIP